MQFIVLILDTCPCSADENAMRTEINQLLSHINELKLLVVSHKIDRVNDFITRLEMIAEPSQATPATLLPRAYEEWLENDDVREIIHMHMCADMYTPLHSTNLTYSILYWCTRCVS